MPQVVLYGAVYILRHKAKEIDLWHEVLASPRVFEWNIMHHTFLANSCVDIDGVLCRDPVPEENDDGEKYRRFLEDVEPLVIPSQTTGWLVTCRLEKYREIVEKWFQKHGFKYV